MRSISELLRDSDWPGILVEELARSEVGKVSRAEDSLIFALAKLHQANFEEGLLLLRSSAPTAKNAEGIILRYAVRPIVKKDPEKGAALLEVLRAVFPGNFDFLLTHLGILIRGQRWQEALTLAEGAPQQFVEDGEILAAKIRCNLQIGNLKAASLVARKCISSSPDAKLSRLALTALIRDEQNEENLRFALDAIHSVEIDDEVIGGLAVQSFLKLGRLDEAIDFGENLLARGVDGGGLRTALGQAYMARDKSLSGRECACAHYQEALRFFPDNLRILTFLGETMLRTGKSDEACKYLRSALEVNPELTNVRVLYARALKHKGNFSEAADEFLHLVKAYPKSVQWQRYVAASLAQAGRRDEAEGLYLKFVEERRLALPEDFKSGLDLLWTKVDQVKLPQVRLDWAWSLREAKDISREEWERRAKWGHLADHFILDWLECCPEKIEQAAEVLAELTEAERFAKKNNLDHRPVLLATAHMGPMYAGPMALGLLDVKARWVASTPSVAASGYASSLISSSDQTDAEVGFMCLKSLKQGYSVAIAVDGAINLAAPTTDFLGQQITYSSFLPRLAYKLNIPSVFSCQIWKKGKIDFFSRRLVDPKKGESVENFAERWKSDYLDSVLEYIQGDPENLRLSGGLWRNIVNLD